MRGFAVQAVFPALAWILPEHKKDQPFRPGSQAWLFDAVDDRRPSFNRPDLDKSGRTTWATLTCEDFASKYPMNETKSIRPKWFQALARGFLRAIGWQLDVSLPPVPKYVLIGAPHTTSWDFLFTMLLIYATGLYVKWIGKDSLFRGPMGIAVRALGGIEVNRRQKSNFVDQIVKVFNQHNHLIIAIAPEGTRNKADYWKTGFYYIALGAGVPVALGFIDFEKKAVGIGPYFYPSGDIKSDFEQHIQNFYAGKKGKYPDRQGSVRLKEDAEPDSR